MAQIDSNTRLSVDRTRLSYERTMMSWIRTAVSLITFGFSIYKFVQIETVGLAAKYAGLFGSAILAPLMIVIGLVALLMAVLENRRHMRALTAQYPGVVFPVSSARLLAVLVSILGIVALIAVLLRK